MAVKDGIAVSVSYDTDARIWDLEKKECLHVLKDHTNKLFSVAFDGKRIVTGSMDKTVRIWDPATGYVLRSVPGLHRIAVDLGVVPVKLSFKDTKVWSVFWSSLLLR